jgi:hypothetical protein
MTESPTERRLRAHAAAHTRWAKTDDRRAALAPARKGLRAKFEREVDPDGVLPPDELARRADSAEKAYYLRLAAAGLAARRRKRGAA